jgi:hypothetical protein
LPRKLWSTVDFRDEIVERTGKYSQRVDHSFLGKRLAVGTLDPILAKLAVADTL